MSFPPPPPPPYDQDVHFVKNDLGFSAYPMTPGHELAGVVTAVGKNVTKLAVGDNGGGGGQTRVCMCTIHERIKSLGTSTEMKTCLYYYYTSFMKASTRVVSSRIDACCSIEIENNTTSSSFHV